MTFDTPGPLMCIVHPSSRKMLVSIIKKPNVVVEGDGVVAMVVMAERG